MSLVYSALGLFASLSGMLFGRISSHPYTYIGVGMVMIFSGLSMWGLVQLPFIKLGQPMPMIKRGYWSTFIMGISSGLIIGPCVTSVLAAVLAYVATTRNVLYGASLLFTFSVGMGTLLVIVGTFSGLLVNLRKLGPWLEIIRNVGGAILMVIGAYFISVGIRRLM
jgi:thiol:disulfide interchange protein DsbD